jgi:hypothetical protein
LGRVGNQELTVSTDRLSSSPGVSKYQHVTHGREKIGEGIRLSVVYGSGGVLYGGPEKVRDCGSAIIATGHHEASSAREGRTENHFLIGGSPLKTKYERYRRVASIRPYRKYGS